MLQGRGFYNCIGACIRLLRYWVLPDGRAVNWSLIELASKEYYELIDPNAPEAYQAVGREFGYEPLGMLPDAECEA